jgi:hypothetical protein
MKGLLRIGLTMSTGHVHAACPVVCSGEFPFVADNLAAFAVLMKDCKFKPIPVCTGRAKQV